MNCFFLILLDYRKAFDIANHKLILPKLAALGFDDSALTWLGFYLEGSIKKLKLIRVIRHWFSLRIGCRNVPYLALHFSLPWSMIYPTAFTALR